LKLPRVCLPGNRARARMPFSRFRTPALACTQRQKSGFSSLSLHQGGRKGTGMGLASVYGIVKQHRGFVRVYDEVGQGSLFRVYLPATSAELPVAQAETPAVSGTEMRGTELILIAEDHESIREMARQTLQHLGYQVLSAENGEVALNLLE